MVFIIDGGSEHNAHVWIKTDILKNIYITNLCLLQIANFTPTFLVTMFYKYPGILARKQEKFGRFFFDSDAEKPEEIVNRASMWSNIRRRKFSPGLKHDVPRFYWRDYMHFYYIFFSLIYTYTYNFTGCLITVCPKSHSHFYIATCHRKVIISRKKNCQIEIIQF